MIAPHFASKLNEVYRLCECLAINELYFFGSSINGKFILGKSDLDVLVDTDDEDMKNVVRLNIELNKIYGCKVDLFHAKWKNHHELMDYLKENKELIFKRK
jgi:predicted nucleotidyltransferase